MAEKDWLPPHLTVNPAGNPTIRIPCERCGQIHRDADERCCAAGEEDARCHICHKRHDEPGELWCSGGHPTAGEGDAANG